ncbi:MAG: fibronectin type III domain-containing protein, partial [Promethearchaeota archaeon]
VIVSVNITDPSGIDNATCVYRINSGFWQSVIMTHGTGDTYSCNLGSYIVDDVVEYYILTFDNTTMHNWANTTVQMFEIFNQPPTDPTLANPGTVTYASYVYVTWTPSTDLEGSIDHYHIQISRFDDFSVILNEWNETTTNFNITDLTSGIYYIRVRAFDFHNASSQWSNVESIEVILTTTTPTPPPTTTPTPTPTSPTSPTTGSPFDPDILNLVFLITTIGSLVIIIIVVVGIIRQRSRSQRKYQF